MQNFRSLMLGLGLAGLLAGCVSPSDSSPPRGGDPVAKSPEVMRLARRNNAASLLHQLLEQEKNIKVLLYIKLESDALDALITEISDFTGKGTQKLEAMSKADASLKLDELDLPPGEVATREAIAASKRNALLLSGGKNFEFNLLLAQVEALNYGSHLAQVAAENSAAPAEVKEFTALSRGLADLYQRAIALLRPVQP